MQVAADESLGDLIEARIESFDASGNLKIYFTKDTDLFGNIDSRVISFSSRKGRTKMRVSKGGRTGLVEAVAVTGDEVDFDEETDLYSAKLDVLDGWEIVNIDEEGIELKFKFKSPLHVSNGENPDKMFVQIALGSLALETTQKLPESVIKFIEIPRQMASEE